MSKLISNDLRLFNVEQLVESFSEPNFNIYYLFVGNSVPYEQDNSPPILYDNPQNLNIESYNKMLYGKRLTSSDVSLMVKRHDWSTGVVYSKYSHDKTNLFDSNFYVVVDEGTKHSVFKCLDNKNGSPSTDAPSTISGTLESDDFYFTNDGYQWKFMYSIPQVTFEKFSTSDFIPVLVNANVVANAVSGSIDNIEVVSGGENYSSYTNGTFQAVSVNGIKTVFDIDPANASSNSGFYVNCALKVTSGTGSGQQRVIIGYTVSGSSRRVFLNNEFDVMPTTTSTYEISPLVTITGDGEGATARAIVNPSTNAVANIEIVTRGNNYTYATVTITGNTGIVNVQTGTAITANTATAKVIISPKNGHGSNAASELGSRYVCMSTTFDASLSGGKIIDTNDFRTIGVIKDPRFANVQIEINNATGIFSDGELVTQANTEAFGTVTFANSTAIRMTDVYKFFQTGNSTYGVISGGTSGHTAQVAAVTQPTTYFDQTLKLVATLQTGQNFSNDEPVFQGQNANGYYYWSNTTIMKVTDHKGVFNQSDIETNYFVEGEISDAKSLVTGIIGPDLVKNKGDVIYMENFPPIQKTSGQTETVKLILKF